MPNDSDQTLPDPSSIGGMPPGPVETVSPGTDYASSDVGSQDSQPSETSAETSSTAGATPAHPPHALPAQIGPYRIIGLLGQGGMGQVLQAEQLHPVRRLVALKIIKLGMDSREVITRFEAERQALALMNHPSVAKVYDAGVTDRGQPYFAMELVSGVPLTRFCDEHQLTTRQRLELFVEVCRAVQHAHQKGIIHRDLKPSNILVSEVDDRPVPKVIDFGIAKATNESDGAPELVTHSGLMIGTLAYMSPEQAAGSLDVDTRTDIYSLGVVLYELLTGQLPLDPAALRAAGMDGAVRMIREAEPAKPSTRFGSKAKKAMAASSSKSLGQAAGAPGVDVSRQRRTDLRTLHRELRADLDWITLKAMEKDRNRRYETANGLAADVQRHLNDEPVIARPPTFSYRLAKLTRRHKAGVAATIGVALALIAGMAGTTYGFIRARSERDKVVAARASEMRERDRAEQAERGRKLQLVDELNTASPEAVPAIITSLAAMPELVTPPLLKKFDDPAATPQERLRAACALSAMPSRSPDVTRFLVGTVLTAPAAESENVISALRYAGDEAIAQLRQKIATELEPDILQRVPIIARYSFTLLSLGSPGGVSIGMKQRPDLIGRTAFIGTFASWHGDLRPAAAFLRKPDNPYSRSGLCAALGTLDPASLPAVERQAVADALAEVYRSAPDSGSHSAAAWALRRWGIPRPPVAPTPGPVPGRDWFINGQGMTMLRLPSYQFTPAEEVSPPLPFGRTYNLTLLPFFICDCETSIETFNAFMKDAAVAKEDRPDDWPGPEEKVGPTPDCPVQNVNLMDAIVFCNWLSRREGRTAGYRYVASSSGPGTWTLNLGVDGYRLPSGAEWECACRAGTLTTFPFGEETKYLMDYMVIGDIRDLPCGSKQPNAWGLFDMLGNAWEMTWQNATGTTPTLVELGGTPPKSGSYLMRGGSFDGGTAYTMPSVAFPNSVDRRAGSVGFRVVFSGR